MEIRDKIRYFHSEVSAKFVFWIIVGTWTVLFMLLTGFFFYESSSIGWYHYVNTPIFLFSIIGYLWAVSISLSLRKDSLRSIFHPEKNLTFISYISIHITYIVLSLSFTLSVLIIPINDTENQYRISDFLGNSSFINMTVSMYFGAFGLLTTMVVLQQQRYEILGFDRFLTEATKLFNEVLKEAEKIREEAQGTENNLPSLDVYIVDFQPFIGSKSVKDDPNSSGYYIYKKYLNALNTVAKHEVIRLNIICHSEDKIKSAFGDSPAIPLEGARKLSINDAITKIAKHDNVSIWRSKDIGPYHFLITPAAAIEFLVVPESPRSNKNKLIATKTEDISKIEYLTRTAEDIIANAIKPKAHLDTIFSEDSDRIIELKLETPTFIDTHFDQNFNHVKRIKLRFQFENERGDILNPLRGYYPTIETETFQFSKGVFGLKLVKQGEFTHVVVVPDEKKLFHFNENDIWFDEKHKEKDRRIGVDEVRSGDASTPDRVFLKVQYHYLDIDDETKVARYITEYSHKTPIKLW